MTHINPGTDTTINPVIINDTHRQKQHPDLVLHVKKEYFQLIAEGSKKEEYRKVCLYWGKRLDGKTFGNVVIACGYPSRFDEGLWITFPWNGCYMKTIYHKEWNHGDTPVIVYAIRLHQQQGGVSE